MKRKLSSSGEIDRPTKILKTQHDQQDFNKYVGQKQLQEQFLQNTNKDKIKSLENKPQGQILQNNLTQAQQKNLKPFEEELNHILEIMSKNNSQQYKQSKIIKDDYLAGSKFFDDGIEHVKMIVNYNNLISKNFFELNDHQKHNFIETIQEFYSFHYYLMENYFKLLTYYYFESSSKYKQLFRTLSRKYNVLPNSPLSQQQKQYYQSEHAINSNNSVIIKEQFETKILPIYLFLKEKINSYYPGPIENFLQKNNQNNKFLIELNRWFKITFVFILICYCNYEIKDIKNVFNYILKWTEAIQKGWIRSGIKIANEFSNIIDHYGSSHFLTPIYLKNNNYIIVNYNGFFSYNTWLYAYFNHVNLIGLPFGTTAYDFDTNKCAINFVNHDLGHIRSITIHVGYSDHTIEKCYQFIVNSKFFNQLQKETLLFTIFFIIHEDLTKPIKIFKSKNFMFALKNVLNTMFILDRIDYGLNNIVNQNKQISYNNQFRTYYQNISKKYINELSQLLKRSQERVAEILLNKNGYLFFYSIPTLYNLYNYFKNL